MLNCLPYLLSDSEPFTGSDSYRDGKKLANPDTLRFALVGLPAPNYTTEPLNLSHNGA
jgi:hypothetical protein